MRLIDSRARDAGLAAVALKGAALQAMGLYAAGERPMADIDLLVQSADLAAAARVLTALGYHEVGMTWKHRSFDPEHGSAHAAEQRPEQQADDHRQSRHLGEESDAVSAEATSLLFAQYSTYQRVMPTKT